MDLGEIGVILVAEGEAEARGAVERFVRARDAAVRSMEEGAQREVRAAEAIERAIQREIREYDNLVRTASGLERAYQDLVASFNPLNRAQLEYARSIEMLDSALESNVINEQQRARAMDMLQQRMASAVEAERTVEIERVARATAEHTREILNAQDAYDRLSASLDPLVAAQQKYDAGIDVLNQAEAKRIITIEQRIAAEKRLEGQLAKDMATANARQRSSGSADEEKQALAARKLKAELDSLTATVEVSARAQQLYDRAVRITTQSIEKGAIGADRAAEIMAATNSRIEAMGHIVNQNGEVLSRNDTSWQRWARGGVQNAGYQVADFAVQVQGGTSAIVAFGQQAPQFLGMFGAVGAVAGAVVAIMAAVVSAFVLTRGESKTLKDSVDSLESSVRAYDDTMSILENKQLDEEFGNLAQQVRDVTTATKELDRAMLLSNLTKSVKMIKEEFIEPGAMQSVLAAVASAQDAGQFKEIEEYFRRENFESLGLSIGYDVYQGMIKGITDSANSGDIEAVADGMSELLKQGTSGRSMIDMDGNINKGTLFLLQLKAMYQTIALANAEMNGTADAAEKAREHLAEAERAAEQAADAAKRIAEAKARELAKGEEMLVNLHNQSALAEATMRYGEDSLGVETLKAQQAREQFQTRVQALDIEQGLRDILMDSYDEMVGLTAEASNFASEASRAAAEFSAIIGLISTIQGQIASLGLSNIGKEARLAALRAGQTEGQATLSGTIATERARLAPALGAGEGVVRAGAQAELDAFIAAKEKELALDTEISSIVKSRREAEKGDGGGGSGGSKGKDDPLAQLVERIKLERELLGVTESERDVRMAVAKADQEYTEQAINNAVAIIEQERAIIEQRKEMDRLSEFIGGQVGDALMSIVDGTKSVKDAFKDMARAVIMELYRVLVVQRIVNAVTRGFGGLIGNANGNAFSNGSVVPYADGGVVSRPTLFPMSNGQTGLMGEAGPEAILPLKRGPGGKLGVAASGTGDVTVNNNISVTGSDSEAVRREINKMIPQISKVTTAAVMDARKRGGTMKATFG